MKTLIQKELEQWIIDLAGNFPSRDTISVDFTKKFIEKFESIAEKCHNNKSLYHLHSVTNGPIYILCDNIGEAEKTYCKYAKEIKPDVELQEWIDDIKAVELIAKQPHGKIFESTDLKILIHD